MGIDCSKSVPKISKSTVTPKPYRAPQPPPISSAITVAHGAPAPRKKPPAPQPKQRLTNVQPCPSPARPVQPVADRPAADKPAIKPAPVAQRLEKPAANDGATGSSASIAKYCVASIDTNSIIFDRSDDNLSARASKPPIGRSYSVDSASDQSVNSEPKKTLRRLNRFFKSNVNLSASNAAGSSENSLNFMRIYHRLSDGVHTLFNGNLSGAHRRNMSASDTNLSVPARRNGDARRGMLSQQQLIDNDYCPSVLYNRKARKSCSDRDIDTSQTRHRLQQFFHRFAWRKQPATARETYVFIYFTISTWNTTATTTVDAYYFCFTYRFYLCMRMVK